MWGTIEQFNLGNDKTAYLIGLFGTGRWYVIDLMRENIGERGKYLKDAIRFHTGFPRSGDARDNEPHTGSGQIGVCRCDFCLSSSPRFVADKLDLVADIHARQQDDSWYLGGS